VIGAFDWNMRISHRKELVMLSKISLPGNVGVLTLQPPPQSYHFNWPSACLAATVAAVAITVYMLTIPRLLGIEAMDIGITMERMADPSEGQLGFLVRLAWHLGNGVVYVFPYAAVLLLIRRQSYAGSGAVFGVVLWLLGPMLLIPITLSSNPQVAAGELTNPGIFMLALGQGWKPAMIDLGAHLTHGMLAGKIYKHRLS
jgi:hypothetical protein